MDIDEEKMSKEAELIIEKWKKSRADLTKRKNNALAQQKQKGAYIKFPNELKIAIQLLAAMKHMGYQTYLKYVLAEHVELAKRDGKISTEIIEQALAELSLQD